MFATPHSRTPAARRQDRRRAPRTGWRPARSRAALLVRPDADVVGLPRQPYPVFHTEPAGHLAWQLHAPGPVEYRVLNGLADGTALGEAVTAQGLAAGAPVADRDRAPYLG